MSGTDERGGTTSVARFRVRVPKTAELVAGQLRAQIIRGELKDGDTLPPEVELVERYGISRPTLREAYRVLESESLISVRRGAGGGARVHAPSIDAAARNAGWVLEHRRTTMADIYQARTIIEVPCAGRLARTRTPEQLDVLWAKVGEAEAAIDDQDRFIRFHTEFHGLVVDMADPHRPERHGPPPDRPRQLDARGPRPRWVDTAGIAPGRQGAPAPGGVHRGPGR
jgi:DNA-binding FadR family transcriptional regulator